MVVSAAALANPPAYDRARAVGHYTGVLRNLVQGFKYGDKHDARRLFTNWLAQAGGHLTKSCSTIVPVPLHASRLRQRRFNQAAILAQDLAANVGLRYEPQTLVRARKTNSQVGLTRDQRWRNLQGAFEIPSNVKGKMAGASVLLVDDVITTGSTIEACARVLKRAGASRVDVIALAMVTEDSRVLL